MNPLILDNSIIQESPIIVALDYDSETKVMDLVKQLNPLLCKLKIGKELFTACGPKLVEKLVSSGYKVFLDLKFHDIPNTVYKACKVASSLGVWMTNVHASGGAKMLEMAKKGIDESNNKTLLIAVTVLTSMNQTELSQIGITKDINNHTINLAKLSYNAGLDGVVCSAHEAKSIKIATSSEFLTIVPGIRLTKNITDDQQRIMTPDEAKINKADYLVIGRPITNAISPYEQLCDILRLINHNSINTAMA